MTIHNFAFLSFSFLFFSLLFFFFSFLTLCCNKPKNYQKPTKKNKKRQKTPKKIKNTKKPKKTPLAHAQENNSVCLAALKQISLLKKQVCNKKATPFVWLP